MVNNTRVNELQNKLLQAMDIINAHALNNINFDKTITCTIEDDTYKKEGKYEVSDGSKFFMAYTNDTKLRKNDVVYVTIPQGNFENQKMIIGKKTSETDTPFVFTTPFDTIFDMTDNITLGNISQGALIANALNKYGNENYEHITLYDKACNYYGYTRLGLKGNFKSWIKNATKGTYGLTLILTVNNPNTASSQQLNSQEYYYTFSNLDMYGNSYNFETDYEQQLVIPIEEIKGTITNIKINFYQQANFVDRFNEPIPCSISGYKMKEDGTNLYEKDEDGDYILNSNDDLLEPNLFVNDIYLCFGYDMSIFTEDMVEIYTQQPNTYKHSENSSNDGILQNRKEIKMRWVHIDNGTPIDMIKKDKDSKEERPYEIRWYRYQVGAPAADAYSGVYWTRIKNEYGNEISDFSYNFDPNIDLQQEKIKVIIIYNNTPYYSNELFFENEQVLPPSAEALHIANALNIVADDNTNGNYMVYGQDNNIKDTEYGKLNRSLSIWFDGDSNGEITTNERIPESEAENLLWTFPAQNTMIELVDSNKWPVTELDENGKEKIIAYQVNTHEPWYKIKTYYTPNNSNNTITCQYQLNGRVYKTKKEFTFGPAGTMGTDQTLVIDFVNDTNAVNKTTGIIENVNIEIQLYNNQNIKQEIPDGSVTWSWYYNSALESAALKAGNQISFPLVIEENKNSVINFSNEDFLIDELYILQGTVGSLTTYFPVAIKNGDYDFIKGPTQVIYQANGEPAYSREPYELYANNDFVQQEVKWKIIHKIPASDEEKTQQQKSNFIGTIDSNTNKLQPLSVYGIQAYQELIDAEGKPTIGVLWTQPILVLQNQWPNGVINAWDGKSLVLDEETSTILAAAISAGKKNDDNTFSGVMIGDWGNKDVEGSISKQTGVYGFNHGAMSYAFKEDGTAFLGKDGAGRIYFNGNNATIYSPFFDRESEPYGMKIDLNNASINMKYNGNNIKLDAHEQGVVEGFTTMSKAPFTIGDNFAVAWDGTLYANGGNFKGIISASILKSSKDIWNSENTSGGIILDGYFSIPTKYKDEHNIIKTGPNGYLGFVESNISNGDNIEYPGIGLSITSGTITSVIKATTAHAGMSSGNGYVSTTNSNVSIGVSGHNRKFLISGNLIALYYKENTASAGQNNNGQYLAIEPDTNGNGKLVCWGIPPANQSGIYARFA